MTAPSSRITRRNILIGVFASLVGAPAIVRASSLMPVRCVPLQILTPELKTPRTLGEWYQLCFYNNLENALEAGRAMTTVINNGKILSVTEAHRMVARAREKGWLPPYRPTI